MKKYKDGKIVEVSNEEAEKAKKRFEKFRNKNQLNTARPSLNDHEIRIKALEEAMAKLLAKEDAVEETSAPKEV